MSFWKQVESWAKGMEERRAERQEKQKSASLGRLEFQCTIASLFGDMCKLFENNFTLLIVRFNEMLRDQVRVLDMRFSDTCKVLGDIIKEAKNQTIAQMLVTADDADRRAAKRHDKTANFIFGLLEHQQKTHKAMLERFNIQDRKIEEFLNVVLNTQTGLFERLAESFQAMSGPSLEWFMENYDELMKFGVAARNLQENNVPPNMGASKVAQSLGFLVSADARDIAAALDAKMDQQANAA